MKFLTKIPFWLKTVIAFAAGVAVALMFGKAALPVFDPIGDTFIRAIKMLVAPLVFSPSPPRWRDWGIRMAIMRKARAVAPCALAPIRSSGSC